MPLMKVRKENDTGWYTVEHLNFNYIGLGVNEPITLMQGEKEDYNALNKIYVYDGKNDYPYNIENPKEEIMYKSSTEALLAENWMPAIKNSMIETSMNSVDQKDKAEKIVNEKAKTLSENTKNGFLLEHRTLIDKQETFHVLHYWNGSSWIPLNNIWG